MVKIHKIEYLLFYLIFALKKIISSTTYEIIEDDQIQECIKDGQHIHDTFTLSCLKKVIITTTKCSGTQVARKDIDECVESINCGQVNNVNVNPLTQNYYGIYYDDILRCPEDSQAYPEDSYGNTFTDCKYENMIKCQWKVNQCIFEKVKANNFPSCDIIDNISGHPKYIYDGDFKADSDSFKDIKYSLDPKDEARTVSNNELKFWVAKFFLNGTLFQFEELENDFLQCSNSVPGKTNYKKFGYNIESKCNLDVSKHLDKRHIFFYEIFLENNLKMQQQILVPIPIEMTDIKNQKSVVTRMFLYYSDDNIHFYYAKKIKLKVQTQKGNQDDREKIFMPYFEVTYDLIESATNTKKYPFTFISEYQNHPDSINHFMRSMKIVLIVLCVVIGLVVFYRSYVWYKLNPPELIKDQYALQFVIMFLFKLFKYVGIFFFWFTFGISAYWYFFYKLQYRIKYLMPPLSSGDYKTFRIVFRIGFWSYMLFMFSRIYEQVTYDIFFIDWEIEKDIPIETVIIDEKNKKQQEQREQRTQKYRSAWRMVHVVNQFNKMQTERIINLYFGFSWIILLYFRCHWDNKERQVPKTPGGIDLEDVPKNFVLRHFIASIIVVSSGAIDFMVTRFLQIWIPLRKTEFLDLCSVANISVFILDAKLHGYYIHGLSPIGSADVNNEELLKFLENEKSDRIRQRGLENDNNKEHNDNQSYEMFISNRMRTIYDGLHIIQTNAMLAKVGDKSRMSRKRAQIRMRLFGAPFSNDKNDTYLDNYMNNELKNQIDLIISNSTRYIRDKSLFESILGLPLNNSELLNDNNNRDLILYRDYNTNFDNIIFYGMEWQWFVMDIYIFQMWMIVLKDVFISIFLTFVCDKFLYYIRVIFGEKNLAHKAVIDERFID